MTYSVEAFQLPAGTFCSKIVLVPKRAIKAIRSGAARTAALNKRTRSMSGVPFGPNDATLPKEIVRRLSNLLQRLQQPICLFSGKRAGTGEMKLIESETLDSTIASR